MHLHSIIADLLQAVSRSIVIRKSLTIWPDLLRWQAHDQGNYLRASNTGTFDPDLHPGDDPHGRAELHS